MSTPPTPAPPRRPLATLAPAVATLARTQKCLFQNGLDWPSLKTDGDDESKKAAEQNRALDTGIEIKRSKNCGEKTDFKAEKQRASIRLSATKTGP